MSFIGVPELLLVLAVVLLLLGPKRLPALGRSLGGGIRNFTAAIRGDERRELPPSGEPDGGTESDALDGELVDDRRRR